MIKAILQAVGIFTLAAMLIFEWRAVPITIVGGLLLWDWWRHRPSVPTSREPEEATE